MSDSKKPVVTEAISQLELEKRLLQELDASTKRLNIIYSKLSEVETKVFDIVLTELDQKDANGVSMLGAEKATIIYHKLADAIVKKERLKLDQFSTLHGIKKNAEMDLGDDINDGIDDDITDAERREAQKVIAAHFRSKKDQVAKHGRAKK